MTMDATPKTKELTRKAWVASLKTGQKIYCTFRHYWDKPGQPTPQCGYQECEILRVGATVAILKHAECPRWTMPLPPAKELRATPLGFDLFMKDGRLMSRYVYERPVNTSEV